MLKYIYNYIVFSYFPLIYNILRIKLGEGANIRKCPRGEGHAFSDWKGLFHIMTKMEEKKETIKAHYHEISEP